MPSLVLIARAGNGWKAALYLGRRRVDLLASDGFGLETSVRRWQLQTLRGERVRRLPRADIIAEINIATGEVTTG